LIGAVIRMLILDQLKRGDRQLRVLALGMLLGLGVLLVGLFYVQVIAGKRYRASQVNQSFRTVRLPAVRGLIVDAQGRPLADNRPVYNVHLYLEELRPLFQAEFARRIEGQRLTRSQRLALGLETRYSVVSNLVARTAEAIGQPLELEAKAFHKHYEQRLALPMPIATDLSLEAVARFVEQATGLPGIELQVLPVRSYPEGSLAAHVLGYLKRDDRPKEEDFFTRYSLPDYRGVVGIEGVWDPSLRGRPGIKSVLVNNLGYRESETVWEPAEAGDTVHLTLDIDIQRAVERALRGRGERARGAIVVMDVETGDVVAMASAPTYEPAGFLPRIHTKAWEALNDPVLLPLFNRASFGFYAPGSIFKIVVALAALEAGILDPERVYHSPGYYQLGSNERGRRIRDMANGGMPSSFNFKKAFKQSSNAYFVHYGLLTGLDDIVALGQRLHLGEETWLPIGQEAAGIFPTPEWRMRARQGRWMEWDTASLSIGQGAVAVTPVQMAVMTSAVANGGRVLWPRLVTRVVPSGSRRDGEPFRIAPGKIRDHLGVSARALEIVREGMLADVEDPEGTGRQARMEGYRIAAKTGTAQVQKPGYMDHITWFVAFGPFEAPRYATVVMIESGDSGGETCAPLAREDFESLRQRDADRSAVPLAMGA